jgi:ribosomal protein L22
MSEAKRLDAIARTVMRHERDLEQVCQQLGAGSAREALRLLADMREARRCLVFVPIGESNEDGQAWRVGPLGEEVPYVSDLPATRALWRIVQGERVPYRDFIEAGRSRTAKAEQEAARRALDSAIVDLGSRASEALASEFDPIRQKTHGGEGFKLTRGAAYLTRSRSAPRFVTDEAAWKSVEANNAGSPLATVKP